MYDCFSTSFESGSVTNFSLLDQFVSDTNKAQNGEYTLDTAIKNDAGEDQKSQDWLSPRSGL